MMSEDSEYCLRWHRHLHNFVESFETLLENEALADVYFFAEGQLVKAHKVVLSSCSTYFQSLFKETIERHPIIVLKDFKLAHIKALLQFMYRGTVNVPRESLEPIMKMAETLNIKGLADGVVDVEKVEPDDNTPMSLIHPKIANSHYSHPPHSTSDSKGNTGARPHLSHMYNTPSTSVHSVLSTALTMPSALSLTSPLSLPHLASLPPNLASSLASTLSNAIPQSIASFISPRDIPLPDGSDSPVQKRRRKHRRRSGETNDSGDSDARSSGSPGDSVPNLHLPRIPATITPIGLHRQHLQQQQQQQQYHQNSSHPQQQHPRDLSIHSSQNHSGSHASANHERSSSLDSPHRERFHGIKPPPPNIPGLLLHPPVENHQKPPQDEPENLERRPSSHPAPLAFKHDHHERVTLKSEPQITPSEEVSNRRRSESPHRDKSSPLTSGRRSDEERSGAPRQSPKCGGSDPESLLSPSKRTLSQSRLDETSSDNNHDSDDDRDDNANGHRDPKCDRLSDSTPGPSTSRPHSQEAPQTPSFLGWPYSSEANSSEESFPNLSGDSNQDYFRALNLVRAGFSGILPPRVSSELYSHPSAVPLGIPLLLKGGREKSTSKNILGYPFPETPKQFTCDKCGRSYASTGNLKRHKKYECGVEPQFSCPICKKKFQHRHSVKIHVFSTHRNEAGDGGIEATREGPSIFSTPDVPSVGTASWPIPQEAPSAGPQNQEG